MRRNQHGFSLIELLIVVAVILVIAAIAIPSFVRSRERSNEASAVSSLHAINTACVSYSSLYNGYPALLSNLGPAAVATSSAADLLDSLLAAGHKSGYSFTYTAGPVSAGTIQTYTITADPLNRGVTGERGFFTNESFVIRFDPSATATASSPPLQ